MREIGNQERLHLFLNYGTMHNVKAFRTLMERFPDPEEAFACAKRKDEKAFDCTSNFIQHRLFNAAADGFLERYLAWLFRHDVGIAIPEHAEYPALLKQIPDPPSVLFYKGSLKGDISLPIAVIGARRCTKYGKDIAKLFSLELVKRGATIISGMAAGIDSMAARGALDCESSPYPTIAVLGTGIDVIYPKGNETLYQEISARGAVITEFLPGEEPLPEHFPIRNRIISGIAKGTVVVEAGDRSGTSITAGFALDQGRDVFAVPGRITDLMSVGTNRLIQSGAAKPVFCAEDILCEYGRGDEGRAPGQPRFVADQSMLNETEKRIVDAMRFEEQSIDELVEQLGISAPDLNCALTALEFSGIIKPLPGRRFALELEF